MPRPNMSRGTDTPAGRLIAAREAAGFGTAKGAAEHFDWSLSTTLQHESGLSIKRAADKYAAAYNTTPEWLLYGDEAAPPALTRSADVRPTSAEGAPLQGIAGAVFVPHYPVAGAAPEPTPFSRGFLDRLGLGDQVAVVVVDEATDEFCAGDTLLINTADTDTSRAGPFVVRSNTGRLAVLRLHYMIGTEPPRVHVSVSGAYPHAYDVSLGTLPVIGRVVWVGRALRS